MAYLRFIPNALSILRMLLVIPIVWLLLARQFQLTLVMFATAAFSDGLDGFLAKRCGWTSALGKILDPLADKILLVGVFVALAVIGAIPVWFAAIVVTRDVVITAGAIAYQHLYGDPGGKPTWMSKINTLSQVLLVLAVVGAPLVWGEPSAGAGTVVALSALVLVTTVVSGLDYVFTYSRKAAAQARLPSGKH